MVEVEGERVLAASCQRRATPGLVVHTATERAQSSRRMVMELLVADQPERDVAHQHDSRLWQWAERMNVTESRLAVPPRRSPPISSHPAMAGQPRRLHPLQPLCEGLPRSAGQRCHRHGVPKCRLQDRLRLRRRDGREHLRRLRGVRAGVPDRRADGGVAGRRSRCRPPPRARRGRQRVPLLRSRLPDHLPAHGQPRGRRRGQQAGSKVIAAVQGRDGPATTTVCA